MDPETVKIEVAPQVAQILLALQRKAEAEGVSLESILLSLYPQNGTHEETSDFEMGPKERAEDLVRWLKAHSARGVIADDSRESIYTREDDAL